jgi:hypothetical protein
MSLSIVALLEANPTLYLDKTEFQLKIVRHVDVSLRRRRVFGRQVDARNGNVRIPPNPGSLSHSRFRNSQPICKGLYAVRPIKHNADDFESRVSII